MAQSEDYGPQPPQQPSIASHDTKSSILRARNEVIVKIAYCCTASLSWLDWLCELVVLILLGCVRWVGLAGLVGLDWLR